MSQKLRRYCWLLVLLFAVFTASTMSRGFAEQDRNAAGTSSSSVQVGEAAAGTGSQNANATNADDFMTFVPNPQGLTAQQSAQRIRQVMRLRIDLRVPNHSLIEFGESLAEKLGVGVTLDRVELEMIGLDPAITFLKGSYSGVQVDTALRDLLPMYDCGYYISGNMIVITSRDKADTQFLTVVYDCKDLLQAEQEYLDTTRPSEVEDSGEAAHGDFVLNVSLFADSGPPRGPDVGLGKDPNDVSGRSAPEDHLFEIITSATGTSGNNGWLHEGTGAGTMGFFAHNLVVSQTLKTHDEIEDLLALLREALATRQ